MTYWLRSARNGSMRASLTHLLPPPTPRGPQHRIRDIVRSQTVAERRSGNAALAEARQKIGHLVDEGMLVADLQSRHPPVLHIRMVAVGNMNRAPAAQAAFVAMVEVFQAMQIVQVPEDRSVLAVDLQRVERLVPARVAGSFESGQRPVLKRGKKGAGGDD